MYLTKITVNNDKGLKTNTDATQANKPKDAYTVRILYSRRGLMFIHNFTGKF